MKTELPRLCIFCQHWTLHGGDTPPSGLEVPTAESKCTQGMQDMGLDNQDAGHFRNMIKFARNCSRFREVERNG